MYDTEQSQKTINFQNNFIAAKKNIKFSFKKSFLKNSFHKKQNNMKICLLTFKFEIS